LIDPKRTHGSRLELGERKSNGQLFNQIQPENGHDMVRVSL